MEQDLAKEFKKASIRNFGEENYLRLSKACVGIAGLGGLGSCAALSLARAAVGKLIIADFDIVEFSNLNRQQYFLEQIGESKTDAINKTIKRINPIIEIESHCVKLTEANIPHIFARCDIICECFDLPDQKQMLAETVLTKMPQKSLICASGMAGFGKSNEIITEQINKRLYLIGDGINAVGDGIGLYAARVGIAANHQANKAIELICGKV